MSQEEARNRRRRELYSQRMAAETKVSPTLKEASKTKKRYFDGTFSDESGCKRFVSFKTSLFEPMREAKEMVFRWESTTLSLKDHHSIQTT